MANEVDILREFWQRGAWRGSVDDLRSRSSALARVAAGDPSSGGVSPHPLLRTFNPACVHGRTSEEIMLCPECAAWTQAHWADRIDIGSAK